MANPVSKRPELNPQSRAIVATACIVVLLGLFTFLGYWYGKGRSAGTDANATNTTTNTAVATTSGSATAKSIAIGGKITKLTSNGFEFLSRESGTDITYAAKVSTATALRKLDYRTIPKNGLGDGVVIQTADLKAGQSVVVIAAKTGSPIDAQRVNLVIYP